MTSLTSGGTYIHNCSIACRRGGAWVVVDSQISSEGYIEMFADPGARGGVLEPEGVVEIKFRTPDLIKLMHRCEPIFGV